jgi:hypothetical protein
MVDYKSHEMLLKQGLKPPTIKIVAETRFEATDHQDRC